MWADFDWAYRRELPPTRSGGGEGIFNVGNQGMKKKREEDETVKARANGNKNPRKSYIGSENFRIVESNRHPFHLLPRPHFCAK